jgi:hypothetical protein
VTGFSGLKRSQGFALVLAILMFACGALAVGWRLDRQKLDCYRDLAEEQLVADQKCERTRLR